MGPLKGFRILEFAGVGPAPMCAMLLADLGADVLRVERPQPSGLGVPVADRFKLIHRSRPSACIDLKQSAGRELALDLIGQADALIEGFRPGTMEKLQLGPASCLQRNPRLVYGRMTGWGQEGPLAAAAGHDLNYIALSGALHAIGRAGQPPTPPLNLVGDYGGGALYLALGLVSGLLEAGRSGAGQVVDAAMIDGAASLMTAFYGLHAAGQWSGDRGDNLLDSGAPYYDVYRCADGQYLAVAPLEAKFRQELYRLIGIDPAELPPEERSHWPALRATLARRFASRTRAEWCRLLEGTDACVAPVLSFEEAPQHPHHRARGTFVEVDGIVQPAPAPRFSRTPTAPPTAPEAAGHSTGEALARWGIPDARVEALRAAGVIGPQATG